MDHLKILKRAWTIVKSYRALWILGLILALTIGGAGSGSGSSSGSNTARWEGNTTPPAEWDIPLEDHQREEMGRFVEGIVVQFEDGRFPGWAIASIVGFVIFVITVSIIFTILRYRAETAQLRMVNKYEEDGTELSFKEGWRLGKSRAAWRMFLLDLGVGLTMFVAVILMLIPVGLPWLLWATENPALGVIGTIIGICMGLLFILTMIVVGITISLMLRFARRLIALEDARPMDAIRDGFKLIRKHWKSVGLMWLIMAGLGIAFAIVSMIVTFIIGALGLLIGGLIGLLIFALSNLAFSTVTAGIIGGVIGFILLLVLVSPPLLFVNGLWINYQFTVWTLTYRELTASAVFDISNAEPIAVLPEIAEEETPIE